MRFTTKQRRLGRGPGVAGSSGGHMVGAGVPCAAHVTREKGWLGGSGSGLGTHTASGGATSEGAGQRGGPNAEIAAAPRSGSRGRTLERGHDDATPHHDLFISLCQCFNPTTYQGGTPR
jgi:hypothetical protein